MERTLKKSTAFLAIVAVFAMVCTGCKKNDSSSDNGGGVVPPTINYGTVQVGDQSYSIVIAGYDAYYDEDMEADVVIIAMGDSADQNANMFGMTFTHVVEIPEGTFHYSIANPLPEGVCSGMLKDSDNNVLFCKIGDVTIEKKGANYKIESAGTASPTGLGAQGSSQQFSVSFEGPLYKGE